MKWHTKKESGFTLMNPTSESKSLGFILMNPTSEHKTAGFTLIELIVAIAILVTLFAISTINISPLPSNTLQSTNQDLLVSDLRSQQTKAMSTDSAYGVHFETASYTLFEGDTYTQGLAENTVIDLDSGINFTNITFPNSILVFSAGTGDVANYTFGLDSVDVVSTVTNKTTTIKINKYGATY